jgi:hypothetical protein
VTSHGVITRGVSGIANGDGHTGVSLNIANLLVRPNGVDDNVLAIGVDPSLGGLWRAVRHQRGDEAGVLSSQQLDETVWEIHVGDASPRRSSPLTMAGTTPRA